ncbi:hypothetical protein IE53DRAFT_327161 [Violaceomyces palustris]|uniref:Uncharacterized protein n=1 Tax=Violaceomyces palustris TaxID=1673888 RepID=A0ACD0P252_9BASI|nr:hypothetical protein IE53DRAFT_327161 [Violaceomyces palustris]
MPPIPFAPSHQSPFKSTLSTSQQARPTSSRYSWPPESIDASLLDPTEWEYLCEGGKNLLVRYIGRSYPFVGPDGAAALALRIPKRSRKRAPSEIVEVKAELGDSSTEGIDPSLFSKEVIGPLLGGQEVLVKSVPIRIEGAAQRKFLEKVAGRVEAWRPRERRNEDGIDEDAALIFALEDLSSPLGTSSNRGERDVTLGIEIKPKWGFLPSSNLIPASSAELKSKFSRFRMHAVLKASHEDLPLERWSSLYDPLDLYSGDKERITKAIKALFRDWIDSKGTTNNLRFFCQGMIVDPSKVREKVAISTGEETTSDLETLQKALSHLSSCGSQNDTQLEESLLAVLEPMFEVEVQPVLSRLSHLQARLDPLDVEGLSMWWSAQTGGCEMGKVSKETDSHLVLEPSFDEIRSVAQAFLLNESREAGGEGQTTALTLRQAVVAFLLSATFKDCSMFLRPGASATEGGKVKLIDLDPKPIGKLAKFQSTDRQVIDVFRTWAKAKGLI